MKFDLHTHTNNSDGIYSPNKLIDLAVKRGLFGIAITDHDNIDGLEEAIDYAFKYNNFKIIPGIEFSTVHSGHEVHILGYFIDYKNETLIELTRDIKKSRIERGSKIVTKINELGMELNIDEVKEFSGENFMGRPHIARALIKRGYVENISEAFTKLIGIDAPAYVDRYKIEIGEVISLIKEIGGISVIAHPGLIKDKKIIDYCIEKGINGIECIYPKHSKDQFDCFFDKANHNELIVTAGSDFHGDRSKNVLLGKYYVGIDTIRQMEMMR